MNTILNRRSVRKYTSEVPPREALEQIVEAGKWAPSAMNQQRYHITVVTAKNKLDMLSSFAKQEMLSNPNLPPHIRERVESPDFTGTHGAPVMILVSRKEDNEMIMGSSEDAALCCENLMLAARALEIGSGWLGAYGKISALPGVKEQLQAEFGIPEGYVLYAGIAFGYPDGGFPTNPRERRTDNVNWVE